MHVERTMEQGLAHGQVPAKNKPSLLAFASTAPNHLTSANASTSTLHSSTATLHLATTVDTSVSVTSGTASAASSVSLPRIVGNAVEASTTDAGRIHAGTGNAAPLPPPARQPGGLVGGADVTVSAAAIKTAAMKTAAMQQKQLVAPPKITGVTSAVVQVSGGSGMLRSPPLGAARRRIHEYALLNATVTAPSSTMATTTTRAAPVKPVVVTASREYKDGPLHKMTSKLVATYVNINQIYYANQKKRRVHQVDSFTGQQGSMATAVADVSANAANLASPTKRTRIFNNGYDDEDHDYIIRPGEIWDERYRVIKTLGKGSFGTVVEAYDAVARESVAVKIIKNRRAFHHQALVEIRVLDFLAKHDVDGKKQCVRMKRNFEFRGHLCIVYELFSLNLYELLRNGEFTGIPLSLVRRFAQQILVTLEYLARKDIRVIHCDLKPENVLLVKPRSHQLKVIDFGSSCFESEKVYTYIQSRFYRSPEIMLGHPYSVAIDMWSLGCMLVEMHTGQPLFNGSTEHEQVCKIHEVLGMPPAEMLASSSPDKLARFFAQTPSGLVLQPSKHYRATERTLEQIITQPLTDRLVSQAQATTAANLGAANMPSDHPSLAHPQSMTDLHSDYRDFLDLIRRMLVYEPSKRMTPVEALRHPFCMRSTHTNTPTVALRRSARLRKNSTSGTNAVAASTDMDVVHVPVHVSASSVDALASNAMDVTTLDDSTDIDPRQLFSSPDLSRLRI